MELRPNRELLDPDFTGYKLSLSPIPVYDKKLENDVDVVHPGESQFSYAHTRLFSLQNYLHQNPHSPDFVYYIDSKRNVIEVSIGPLNRVQSMVKVLEVPVTRPRQVGDYPLSIAWASANRAVINDGAGTIHVASVKKEKWIIVFSGSSVGEPSLTCAAQQFEKELYILNRHVMEPKFDTMLELTVLDDNWQIVKSCKLKISGNVDFTDILSATSILVISQLTPKNAVEPETEGIASYRWSQTSEDVTLVIEPIDAAMSEVLMDIENGRILVSVKDEELIRGELSHNVSTSSWTLENGKLEIVLQKAEQNVPWQDIVKGDSRGVQVQTYRDEPEEASFNAEELEEVDAVSPASLFRFRIDTETVTREVDLSYTQYLFSTTVEPSKPPALCLRSPIDGCVWEFAEDQDLALKPKHVGTFSAFGYVQASKTQRKFITAPPDLSYVTISDAFKHLYIFRQPSPVDGTLRNRETGVRVRAVARQHLLNLETSEEILGMRSTSSRLFVLTRNSFFVIVVNEQ